GRIEGGAQEASGGQLPHHLRGQFPGATPVAQLVAGQLLRQEAVIRQVVVEGLDNVIAVAPGLWPWAIRREVAVRVGVAGDIEPVAPPALAVGGRGEQAIDKALVGVRALISEEVVALRGRWRQAEQVEAKAA